MPDTYIKPEIQMLSTEELASLMSPPEYTSNISEHTISIEHYKSIIEQCSDGEGFFVEMQYEKRVKLRRRLSKAAQVVGCTVTFKRNHRGGEVVTVHRNDETE